MSSIGALAAEGVQHGFSPGSAASHGGSQFENCAAALGITSLHAGHWGASPKCAAVKDAACADNQSRFRGAAVAAAAKGVEHTLGPSPARSLRQLKDRAPAASIRSRPALKGRSKQRSAAVDRQIRKGIGAVKGIGSAGAALKAIEHRLG